MSERDPREIRLLHWARSDAADFTRFTTAMTALQTRIRKTWGHGAGTTVPRAPDEPSERDCVAAVLRHSRLRAAADPSGLFAALAWDVLLVAFLAAADGITPSTAAVAHDAGIEADAMPPVLASLAAAGLIDGLTPSTAGMALVRDYIAQL